jgi:hypothetical protein
VAFGPIVMQCHDNQHNDILHNASQHVTKNLILITILHADSHIFYCYAYTHQIIILLNGNQHDTKNSALSIMVLDAVYHIFYCSADNHHNDTLHKDNHYHYTTCDTQHYNTRC